MHHGPPHEPATGASPPHGRHELGALWCIVILAVACRVAALGQPMRYDESVTWALFSGRSWTTIVSWYPFPNNHVLHSLLAKATSAIAPWEPWALRLPAFLAGVAIVPLTWAVGRRVADPVTALLGAALAAGSTSLVLYSANARGYSLVVALWLVLLLEAHRIRQGGGARHWLAFTLVAAAGLYTIPVMLYPLGAAALWLLLDARRLANGPRRARLAYVAGACGMAGLIALLAYLPILEASGLSSLSGNRFVTAMTWSGFVSGMPRFLAQVVLTWTEPFPWWCAPLMLALAVAGLPSRTGVRQGASLAVATLGWTLLLVLATHRVPFVRVWLFLLPLYLLAVARGVHRLVARVDATRGMAGRLSSPAAAVALAAVSCVIALATRAAMRTDDTGAYRGARTLTALVAPRLRPGDRVLAPLPSNGPLLYYFAERGLDTAALNAPLARASRAFLFLDSSRGQTLEWAIGARLIDPREFAEPRLLGRAAGGEVWETERVAAGRR